MVYSLYSILDGHCTKLLAILIWVTPNFAIQKYLLLVVYIVENQNCTNIVHAMSHHQDIMIFFFFSFMKTMKHFQFYIFINQLMEYIHRKSKKNKTCGLFYPGEIVVYILIVLSQKNVCEGEEENLVREKREKNVELFC